MDSLFAPVCSITTTKRRRFFWAAWWSAPPSRVPFRKPDASDGGAATYEEAIAAAERAAGASLVMIEPEWARAWMRTLRGQPPWPSLASGAGAPRPAAASPATEQPESIWQLLGASPDAGPEDLRAAFRKRALALHPDHGGDPAAFRRLVHAYEEARRRARRPKKKARR